MSLLLKNSLPAERGRKLSFVEKFRNTEEVTKNGGTITGSPTINDGITFNGSTDYISYNSVNYGKSNSMVCRLKFNSIASTQLIVASGVTSYFLTYETGTNKIYYTAGGSQVSVVYTPTVGEFVDIAVTRNGTSVKFFINGSQQGSTQTLDANNDLTIDTIGASNIPGNYFNGEIKYVKLFKSELTAEDISNYSNNSMFNYLNKATLNLNMTMESHDPTNVQTLDVSGNDNHAQLGDGSTASTYPTKLTERHGYSFDGTTDYMTLSSLGNIDIKTLAFTTDLGAVTSSTTAQSLIEFDDTTNLGVFIGAFSGLVANETISISGAGNVTYITSSFAGIATIIVSWNGTKYDIYLNGENITTTSGGGGDTALMNVDTANIGRRNLDDLFLSGNINDLILSTNGLTSIQVKDLHARLLKGVNRQ